MFCQYQYYRRRTEQLQTMVAHSDEKYHCKKMSDCPYTGTTLINNIPWRDWPAAEEDRETEMMEEIDETRARQQGPADVEESNSKVDSEVDRSDRSQCYDVRNCCNIL